MSTDNSDLYDAMDIQKDELVDIRLGYDGTTYPTAGDAVREQIKESTVVLNIVQGKFVNDGYIAAANGRPFNSPTGTRAKYTDYIPVVGGSKIYITNYASYEEDGTSFYDANKQFISGAYIRKDTFDGADYIIYQIPDNARFMRTSCFVHKHDVTKAKVIVDYTEALHVLLQLTLPSDNVTVNRAPAGINGVVFWNSPVYSTFYEDHVHTLVPTDGNAGVRVPMDASGHNIAVMYYDIRNSSAALALYIAYTNKSSKKTVYKIIKTIDSSITNEAGKVSVDLANLTVYENFDETETAYFLIANMDHSVEEDTLSYDVYTLQYELDPVFNDVVIAGDNLTETIVLIQKELDKKTDKESSQSQGGSYLVSPSGKKFIPQISDSGVVSYVPVIPESILFIGNSLLRGFSTFGMSASDSSHDYYHYVTECVKETNPSLSTVKLSGTAFEEATNSGEVQNWFSSSLDSELNSALDLIVVQLGDNVNTPEKRENFRTSCKDLLLHVRQNCPNSIVVWVGMWYGDADKRSIIENACSETGCTNIDISDLRRTENQSYIGATITRDDGTSFQVDSSGVASHPGNRGMRLIANRILYRLGIVDSDEYYDETYDTPNAEQS